MHLPANAPWLNDYVHELTAFQAAKFDDQVDAISQKLACLINWLDQLEIITYIRIFKIK